MTKFLFEADPKKRSFRQLCGSSKPAYLSTIFGTFLIACALLEQDKVAKKPYNPIIGEIFQCSWRLPVSEPGSSNVITMTFCGEQVSHHPPVSAFQISCPQRRMQLLGTVHTQSRFRGLSIYVNMIGKGWCSMISSFGVDVSNLVRAKI